MCQNDAGNQTESHFEKPTDGFVVEFSRQLQSHGSAQTMCVAMGLDNRSWAMGQWQ